MTETDHLLAGHRALLADADRLVVLAERLAGAAELAPLRPAVVASAVHAWSDAVRAHHGAHPLPADLRDDRAALGPALDRLRSAADALAARPDEDTATAVAVELAEARDALREHVEDERAVVLPALSRPRA